MVVKRSGGNLKESNGKPVVKSVAVESVSGNLIEGNLAKGQAGFQ